MLQRIGRYEIIEMIAAGGQATVYRARETQLGRIVALKVMHPHLAGDADYVERFVREARTAASLSHPNVAIIHDVGEEGGANFIAMEFLPTTLHALLTERGALPWNEARPFLLQVAMALRAAERQGIVHRDLKPQNILLDTDGQAKVADFGIARAAEFGTMTATGMVLGTPQYMSPEQAMGERVDIRSDLYSLGIVLYQMLTGQTPLEGTTPAGVISHHAREQDVPLNALADADVPADAESVVRGLLEKVPADRIADPQALIDLIEAPSTEPSVSAPPAPATPPAATAGPERQPPPVEEAGEPRRRRFRPLRWAAALGLLLMGVLWVLLGLGESPEVSGLFFIAGILALVAAGLLVLGKQGRGAAVTALVVVSFAAGGWGISMVPTESDGGGLAGGLFATPTPTPTLTAPPTPTLARRLAAAPTPTNAPRPRPMPTLTATRVPPTPTPTSEPMPPAPTATPRSTPTPTTRTLSELVLLGRANPPVPDRILFIDDMEGNRFATGYGSYADGVYRMELGTGFTENAYYSQVQLPDEYALEVDFRPLGEGRIGAGLFGWSEGLLRLVVDVESGVIAARLSGRDSSPGVWFSTGQANVTDGWNRLSLITTPNEFWVSLNGIQVGYSDQALAWGDAALGYHAFGDVGTSVEFDNLVLSIIVAPEAEAGLSGRVTYAGNPIGEFTTQRPVFQTRSRESGQTCPDVGGTNWTTAEAAFVPSSGAYLIDHLEPGSYCIWASVDAAVPLDGRAWFPGDFRAAFSGWGIPVELEPGEAASLDIPLWELIRITQPIDNIGPLILIDGVFPYAGARSGETLAVAWDPVNLAAEYRVSLTACRDRACNDRSIVNRQTTSGAETVLTFPEADPGDIFHLSISASNARGEVIARLVANRASGWADGLYLSATIPTLTLPTATPTPCC